MGQEKKSINNESLNPVILDLILDALSYGVARRIINSAVEAISPIDVAHEVNGNYVDSLTK